MAVRSGEPSLSPRQFVGFRNETHGFGQERSWSPGDGCNACPPAKTSSGFRSSSRQTRTARRWTYRKPHQAVVPRKDSPRDNRVSTGQRAGLKQPCTCFTVRKPTRGERRAYEWARRQFSVWLQQNIFHQRWCKARGRSSKRHTSRSQVAQKRIAKTAS